MTTGRSVYRFQHPEYTKGNIMRLGADSKKATERLKKDYGLDDADIFNLSHEGYIWMVNT